MAGNKKPTPYQQFLSFCKHFREYFRIDDIIIELTEEYIPDHDAQYVYDPQARIATIYFDNEDQDEPTEDQLRYLAFHEISHIRYGDIEHMIRRREYDAEAVEIALHRLIISDWKREQEFQALLKQRGQASDNP